MRRALFFTAIAIGLAGCQTTGQNFELRRVAVAGTSLKLGHYLSANPDCTSFGMPTVRILQRPESGSLSVREGLDFPSFVASNIRSACNTRRMPSMQLWYAPDRAGTTQRVSVEVIYSSGEARTFNYTIDVR